VYGLRTFEINPFKGEEGGSRSSVIAKEKKLVSPVGKSFAATTLSGKSMAEVRNPYPC